MAKSIIQKYNLGQKILGWHFNDGLSCGEIAKRCNAELSSLGLDTRLGPDTCYQFVQRRLPKIAQQQNLLDKLLVQPVDLIDTLKKNANRIQAALDHTVESDGRIKNSDRKLFLELIESTNGTLKLLAEIEGRIQSTNIVNVNLVQENIRMVVQVIQQETDLPGDVKKRLIETIATKMTLEVGDKK